MIASTWSGVTNPARVDVGRRKADRLGQIDLHHRHEALLVGLLVDLHLDIAVLHLLQHLRHEVEAAEQHLARRDAAVGQHPGDARVPVAGVEIGGGVRVGVEIGADAVGGDGEIGARCRSSRPSPRGPDWPSCSPP